MPDGSLSKGYGTYQRRITAARGNANNPWLNCDVSLALRIKIAYCPKPPYLSSIAFDVNKIIC